MGDLVCSRCGSLNRDDSIFCDICDAQLTLRYAESGEARKVVTVLFTDVIGSTEMGEALDPESLRRVMSRYFDEMSAVVQRHGGTVEKFIGDAVMAVFGAPTAHEDDALRAVRAAVEMREALGVLNASLLRTWDVALRTRSGINTGEVSAAEPTDGRPLVAGDTVNVAARLEQAADSGEILVGESTYRLVRDVVAAEPVGPLALRGKRHDVPAYRVVTVGPESAPIRRISSPLVGRESELRTLLDLLGAVERERTCSVAAVLGPAGIGKSRLTAELLASIGDRAVVAEGRCLPYGDGITLWPVVGVLRSLAGIDKQDDETGARARVEEMVASLGDPGLAERVAGLLGLAEAVPGIQQTFWAVRRVFEQVAAARPLVLVFDDIQWGEPTFLDLLEYLLDKIQDAPVLLVCVAREELLDVRPSWMSRTPRTTFLRLSPLPGGAVSDLIRNLVPQAGIPGGLVARIAERAEGNPLFVEETLRMLIDDRVLEPVEGGWELGRGSAKAPVPPTIHALLDARLDRLDADELAVIDRASVVGRVFWWGLLTELAPETIRARVGRILSSLTQKDLIAPDRSAFADEDAFRFSHVLVRDTAYQRVPKATRALLHARIADWLQSRTAGQPGEYEEIVAYHLEQAYLLHRDLGRPTPATENLGLRGATLLASAGARAFAREDAPAAVALFERAVAVVPAEHPSRLENLLELAFALMDAGDFERLGSVAAEIADAAAAMSDERLRAHAVILELWVRLFTSPEGWAEQAAAEAERALRTFEQQDDHLGLARGWALLGLVNVTTARFADAERAWTEAAQHASLAGRRREELEALSWVLLSVWAGPTPVDQGRQRCLEVLERARGDHKATASAMFMHAVLLAALGDVAESTRLIEQARALLGKVGLTVWLAGPFAQMAGIVALTSGDGAAAEQELRVGHEELEAIGEMAWQPTLVALLAEALYVQGRHDEAEELTRISEKYAGSDDASSQVFWRAVRAPILARRGASGEALEVAETARTIAETTDSPEIQARALLAHAEVLDIGEHQDEATQLVRLAVALLEAKGNTAAAARACSRLPQTMR